MRVAARSHDILKIFPYEIWSKCILLAIDRVPEGPLPFLSVSSHWQRLLLDSPVMWSYIHAGDGEDTVARVHTFLHLSGQHSLELAITLYGPIWSVMKPIILLHSKRIYSINLFSWSREKNMGSELLGTTDWPALQIISAGNNSTFAPGQWEHLLTSCPNMQYYRCISFTNDDCRWLGEDTREARVGLFNIKARLGEFGQRFLRLPRLEKINLYIGLPESLKQSQDTFHTFVLSSENLRHLTLCSHYSTALKGLFSSSLGLLRSMIITIPPNLLHIVIKALPSLPSLHQWHLNLQYDKKPWSSPPIERESVPRLRDFSLALHRPSKDTFYTEVLDVLGYDDALCQVETARFKFLGSFVYPTKLGKIRMLLRLVRNVHRLHFRDFMPVPASFQDETSHDTTISMPNLTHLDIDCNVLPLPIDTPRLLMLTISREDRGATNNFTLELPERFGQGVLKLEICWEDFNKLKIQSHNPWSSLQNVQWIGLNSAAGSSTTSFQSITSVEFKANPIHDPNCAINLFLIALLRYPSTCPNLRILKSGRYPVWQLLFDTFNRRNRNKDLARLEEIHLPALPVKSLLSLVVRTLNGDPNIPSLNNVDDILLRRFQHQIITACGLCLSAGYVYCLRHRRGLYLNTSHLRWQENEDGSRHDRRSEKDYLELLDWDSQDFHDSPDVHPSLSWKEWEERLGEVSAGWRKSPEGITRNTHCPRHDITTLKRIHKYTLQGTEE